MVTAAILPTQPQERIASLDVLRAFALLGILVVNMMDFAYTGSLDPPAQRWPAWWDQAAVGIVFALFAGKFNSLFLTYVGRMPLTNYLMQSVVCTLLFCSLWPQERRPESSPRLSRYSVARMCRPYFRRPVFVPGWLGLSAKSQV